MGCWHGTCGLSQLPIQENDETVCIILNRNEFTKSTDNMGGYTYSNSIFEPYSIAIEGIYNGQGGISDVIGDNSAVIKQLSKHIAKKTDIIVDGSLSIENIIEHIERNRVADVGFMLIHKDLYYAVVKDVSARKEFWSKGVTLGEHLNNVMEQYINRPADYDLMIHIDIAIENNKFNRDFKYNRSYYTKGNVPVDNKKAIIELMLFDHAMNRARKAWIPQMGAGSEDLDYDIPMIIAEFAKKKQKQFHEDDDF